MLKRVIVLFTLIITSIIVLIYLLFNPYPYKVKLAKKVTQHPKTLEYSYDAQLFGVIPMVVESDFEISKISCKVFVAKGSLVAVSEDCPDGCSDEKGPYDWYHLHVSDIVCDGEKRPQISL